MDWSVAGLVHTLNSRTLVGLCGALSPLIWRCCCALHTCAALHGAHLGAMRLPPRVPALGSHHPPSGAPAVVDHAGGEQLSLRCWRLPVLRGGSRCRRESAPRRELFGNSCAEKCALPASFRLRGRGSVQGQCCIGKGRCCSSKPLPRAADALNARAALPRVMVAVQACACRVSQLGNVHVPCHATVQPVVLHSLPVYVCACSLSHARAHNCMDCACKAWHSCAGCPGTWEEGAPWPMAWCAYAAPQPAAPAPSPSSSPCHAPLCCCACPWPWPKWGLSIPPNMVNCDRSCVRTFRCPPACAQRQAPRPRAGPVATRGAQAAILDGNQLVGVTPPSLSRCLLPGGTPSPSLSLVHCIPALQHAELPPLCV